MKKLLIFGCAALLLVAFTVPAMADVKIGGIIFTDFYYLDRDKDNSAHLNLNGNDPYTITRIEVPSITRLNATWTNEDNVGMFIEFGLGGENGATGVSLRHAYGWWNVNPTFEIMAGHSTTPFSPLNPSQLLGTQSGTLNIIGIGYGEFYSGRFPQVRGTFNFNKNARLAIALVDPSGGNYGPWTSYQANSKLPRIDIGLPIYAGPVKIYPSFLWQQKSVDLQIPTGSDNSLTTYIGSLGLSAGFGPISIEAEGQWGKNWGNTRGTWTPLNPAVALSSASLNTTTNELHDAETYSAWIDVGFKFGPINPHLMYGLMKSKNETSAGLGTDVKTQMYGISIPIDLAKGFRLRPEFMWYDDGKTKVDGSETNNGTYAIYGVQFQITF